MSRSRMFDDDAPEREGQAEAASPRKTIVGGRPPEAPLALPSVPTGIQRLLRLAAADVEFRAELLLKRDDVAEAVGVALTATERAVLRAASVDQLEAMAQHLPPRTAPRREFFRQTAATAAALLGAPALLACEACAVKGSRPDMPPDPTNQNEPDAEPPSPPKQNEMQSQGGAAPDEPPPPPPKYPAPTGVRPDLPPEPKRPDHSSPTRGISPDVPPEPK